MPQSEITGHLRVYRTGTRVDVISHYTNFGKQKGGGKRGDITGGFSAQSRKRLYELLNSIDEDALRRCLFVTLTYRREHVEPKECKKNLKAFIQSMRRFDATTSGIWKLEFQDRGSPHYHVIVFRRYIPHGWVAATWNRIAEDGDPVHLKAGTEVRAVQKRDSCYAYIGKYMAKLESGGESKNWGRYWGVFNRANLPISEVEIVKLRGGKPRSIIGERAPGICGNDGDRINKLTIFTRSNYELKQIMREIDE